jgi:hypothetical protein
MVRSRCGAIGEISHNQVLQGLAIALQDIVAVLVGSLIVIIAL